MPPEGLMHASGENRRASKPLIEKRRRARINQSLAELKTLVIDSKKDTQSQNARPPKLEKADILEMTVAHVKELHDYLRYVPDPPEKVDKNFKAGFEKCLDEIYLYLDREPSLPSTQKGKLLTYLRGINTSISSSPEQVGNSVDDTTSSFSGHSSRSNTPSAASEPLEINEYPTSMEYVPCSPSSDSNQGSSNSSSPPTNSRTNSCKNISSFPSNSPSGHTAFSNLPSTSSLPKRMEVALTLCNMNKPLNLASSCRPVVKNEELQNQFNTLRNQIVLNEYDRNINRSFFQEEENMPGVVFRSNPEELEDLDLSHIERIDITTEPIWRPW